MSDMFRRHFLRMEWASALAQARARRLAGDRAGAAKLLNRIMLVRIVARFNYTKAVQRAAATAFVRAIGAAPPPVTLTTRARSDAA